MKQNFLRNNLIFETLLPDTQHKMSNKQRTLPYSIAILVGKKTYVSQKSSSYELCFSSSSICIYLGEITPVIVIQN